MKKRADGFGEEEPVDDGFGEEEPVESTEQSSAIRTDGFGEEEPVESTEQSSAIRTDGFGEEEPVDDGFGEEEPVDDGFGAEEPVGGAPEKKSLGIFGTLGAQTGAKAGREVGTVEAIAENAPVVGQIMDAEYNRQWHVIKRLYEGDFNDAIEATKLARSLGFSDEDVRRINDEAGYGGKNLMGNYTKFDMEKGKALYKELVAPEFAKRLAVREAAQQKLNENDLNWVQKGVVGGVGATKLVGSMANTPLAMATLGIDATNRAAQLLEGKWVLDENGQPTKIWWRTDKDGNPVRDEAGNLVPREEVSQDMAVLKGIAGAATERFIWMGLGKAMKWLGAKAIGKMEQTASGAKVSEALAKAASGTMKGVQEATEWLGKTSTGRAVLNVCKALGWLNSKGKFGSIPDMMLKSRIQELADYVVGLAVADPADRESFSEWAGKFFSVKENAELFMEMLAMHLAMKAGGASFKFAGRGLEKIGLKEAREFDRKSAIGRRVEETVAELAGEERAAKLTDKDLVNLYRIVTSDGFTAERAEQFAEKIAGDVDEAQKLIDEGASLSSLAEGLKARRQYSDQFVEGAKAAAAELRDRVTLDGAQSGRINDAALKAAEGNVEIAAKVAALAKAQLTNKHTQVDDAEGLETLVAEAMRPFAPEARSVKIHDMKGNRNVGEQLTALEELGIASVEDAELNGVVRRDENGHLTGGARQAVNIATHGTDALKSAVKDGSIDAETAEALITAAHTELGTEAPEARAAFIDGILDRAKGDAALARKMADIVAEQSSAIRTGEDAEARGGNEKQGIGNEKPGIGNEKPGIGNAKPGIGNAKPKTVSIAKEGIEYRDAKARLDEQKGKDFSNSRTGISARLSSTGARKLISDAAVAKSVANGFTRRQHNEIAANVGALFEDASLVESRPDKAGDINIKSIKRFITPIEVDGREAVAWITVKESTEHGHRIYSVEGIKLAALSPSMRRALADRNSADTAAVSRTDVAPTTKDSVSNRGVEVNEALDALAKRAKASIELEEAIPDKLKDIVGCRLMSIEGGVLGCNRFRGMTAEFGELGTGNGELETGNGELETGNGELETGNGELETGKVLRVKGLGEGQLAKPGNWADGAVLVAELQRVAEKNGAVLDFGSVEANTEAAGLLNKIAREGGIEKAKAKLETRAKLVDILARSALDTGVTFDESSFRKALEETSNGRQYIDNHGNIYGIKSADGTLHFNPLQLDYNIPIHEYGHLALESMKGVNRRLWERGMELVKGSDYYRSIKEQAETEGHEYSYLKGDEAGICDEALAHLIGDKGEKLVEAQGVGAELKAWLKDFWKAFKGAFGLADMTDAQIEKMTLGEFVDAVNAELLRGKEFGTRKQVPLKEKSIKRYDEADGSGSNGVLRWKNDRGRLFNIPVDMERTQPGGRVVLSTDDANITDWIKNRLNGVELRMSKKGKIYVEGRDGFDGELAEIFGRYPKAGQNDGIGEELASVLHNDSLREATPDQLVEMLAKDRANYDEWVKATRDGKTSLEDARLEEHYAEEAAREEAEARQRWEDSGMDVPEYILSRIEDGDPGIDLDWETMREIAHDEAMGRFAVRRAPVRVSRDEYARISSLVAENEAKAAKAGVDHPPTGIVRTSKGIYIYDHFSDYTFSINRALRNTPRNAKIFTDARKVFNDEIDRAATSIAKRLEERRTRQGHGGDDIVGVRDGRTGRGDGELVGGVHQGLRTLSESGAVHTGSGDNRREDSAGGIGAAKLAVGGIFTGTAADYANRSRQGGVDDGPSLKKIGTGEGSQVVLYESGNAASSVPAQKSGGRRRVFTDSILSKFLEKGKGGAAKFAVGGIYTGTAADYANRSRQGGVDDGPSLLKIGTGEGAQVYGWGLYGSTVRGVAEGYAKDAREYNAEKNGKRIDLIFPKNMLEAETAKRLMENGGDVRKTIEKLKLKGIGSAIIKELEEHGAEYSVAPKHEQLYEQTFFTNRAPGDESHLLKWYDAISDANWDRVIAQAEKEGLRDKLKGAWWLRFNGDLEHFITDNGNSGDAIYERLSKLLGTPQAASEFLARAGIDGVKYPVDSYGGKGVKNGDKAGWNYVSFRDDNIRVDHKWTDGQAKFAAAVGSLTGGKKNGRLSDVDQKRLTAVMRGLGTGELKHPRFTTEEFAASKGTEHEQLWNYILSLESADMDGGEAKAVEGGKGGADPQRGDRLGRLRRVATRYGRDPKEVAAADHEYLDRGAESRVYVQDENTVVKVRRLDAYDMDGVKHALAKIVYHNKLFPKDAYRLQDIAVWKNERGFDEYYMILEQPLVTPKRDADGNIIEPSRGHIIEALRKTGQKFSVTGGYYDNGDTPSGSSSGDVVESAKMVAASGDYAVYDFKPGRNTFIDAETGEVRFIDPRIDINDPTDNFAYSKFGKRRRTDAWFDADAQIEAARKQAEARKDAPDGELTAEDEARIREQEEADAALDDENFDVSPSGKGEGKFSAGVAKFAAGKRTVGYTAPDGSAKPGYLKAPNGNDSRLDERQWNEVRTESYGKWFGDWQSKIRRDKLDAIKPMKVRVGAISTRDGLSAAAAAKRWFAKNVGSAEYSTEVGKVVIDGRSIHDSLAHKYSQAKLDAVTTLKDGFATAVYIGSGKDIDGKPLMNHYFAYPIQYGSERRIVFCRAREDAQKNRLYLHEVFVEKNLSDSLQTAALPEGRTLRGGIALMKSILNRIYTVKGEDVSKIVDENGEPLVVYRGAEYDPLAQEPGKGVIKPEAYFTADPEYAKRYTGNGGKVQAYYLNIRNPFDIRRPECLADLKKIYPDHEFQKGKSGALDWAEASTIDGEFLKENFGDKYDGIIYDEGGDPGESGVSYRGISYVPLDGGAQVKSATENIGTFDPGNNDIRFAAGGQQIGEFVIGPNGIARRGTPQAAMIGGARVADDAGYGEQTPGSMAAALERLNQPRTTIRNVGQVRPMSLPLSEMEALRKMLTGDHLPATIAKKIARGGFAAHTKAGRLTIAASVFGLVDKTDVGPAKDRLKQHGFFRNEDEAWAANHSEIEVRRERERSEGQLGDELLKIADRRARGSEAGGESAARGVYANELAKIVMDMPRKEGGVIGRVQKIGDAVRANVKAILGERGTGNRERMAEEAKRFLDWASGGNGEQGTGNGKSERELTDEMFASWLTMPEEMGKIAPTWSEAILRTVAETPKLAEAFKELSFRALSKDSHRAVFEAVRKSQSLAVEKALKELEADRTEKISAGSKFADAKEKIIVTFHDTLGAVAVRIDEKTRQYLKARRKVLAEMKARGATKADIAAVENEIDIFAQKIGHLKNRMELSRTAMERGAWNEGRRYMLQYLLLENKATKKWGLSEEDKSAYLDMMRIVETQGRAASYGMDPRQARLALGDMARRLGAEKWARLEEYGREFFSVMEREFLNDPRVERMWGKGMIDYFRTQAHYVTTKRVQSAEELDAIETARAKAKAAGVNGGDNVIGAMFTYAGPRGGASALGLNESAWKAKLTGSMGAKQEVRSATWEKQQMLMQSARRNQFVLDLRDALLAAKVEGVRDVARGDRDVKPGSRYGTINYVENGVRRTLIVPKQIAEGMKATPDNMPWLTKFHNAARGLMIDWNVAYWNRNVMRNSGSIEKNMPGMHETWLKTVLRVAPGMAPTVDLACQHLARHSKGAAKAMGALFGRDTIFPYIQQAGRMAKLLEDPTAWQERLWDAEARGDTAEVAEMHEDLRQTMEMLKGNMFLPNKAAYGNRETQGFANDMMNKAGFRMVAQMQQQAARTRLGRAVDLVKSPFKRNERQQEYEDVLAKSIAYLHDRAVYGAQRSVEESGLTVKRNVSIAEGERKGTESRTIQRYMTQFFNMTEKGVTRTVRAMQERPGETLGKMARTWVGRFVGSAITYGLVTRAIRALYGDDEEKAKSGPLGEVYGFAKWIEGANKNLSNYVRNHYQTIPLWVSDDGYTTICLGTPLNDEDSLIAPSADFAAKAFANAMGAKNDLALGQMLADTFIRPVTPDLAIATPALKVIRDTIEATMVQNPADLFTGAPTYDRDLYALRNESWETRGDFALAMARQVYNDVGARGFLAVDRQGVDNGMGAAPKWIGLALKKIPILSPVLNSFVKVQVGSPEKDAKPIRADEQRLQHVRNYLSRKLMLESSGKGGALNRTDPQRYAELLEGWQNEYGLSDHDMRLIEKRFLNGWTEHENEEVRRRKVIQGTLRKARKMGIEDAERYMIRGDL